MAGTEEGPKPTADGTWFALGRWQEFEGEGRANQVRIIALVAFYAVELVNYHGLNVGALQMPQVVDSSFHLAASGVALVWATMALVVFLFRVNHIFPQSLKFISTTCDLLLLTSVLILGDGPRSPLLAAYLVILALAALRFSLPLIWFTTLGSASGYLFLLGYARWFSERDIRVPRYYQVLFLLTIVLTGVVLGQVIRRARVLAGHYAATISPSHLPQQTSQGGLS